VNHLSTALSGLIVLLSSFQADATDNTVDMSVMEDGFAAAAGPYGQRKGITYAAWREAGVDAGLLRRAGIRRGD